MKPEPLQTVSSPQKGLSTFDTPDLPLIYIDDFLPPDRHNVVNHNAESETIYSPPDDSSKQINAPVVFPRTPPLIQEHFIPLQKWEGVVDQVKSDYFIARLVDQTGTTPDELAEFMLDEVSKGDRTLVKPGAIFYWNIGYEESLGGQRKRSSIIRFRRLPAWSAHELEAAKHDADRTRDILNWR